MQGELFLRLFNSPLTQWAPHSLHCTLLESSESRPPRKELRVEGGGKGLDVKRERV